MIGLRLRNGLLLVPKLNDLISDLISVLFHALDERGLVLPEFVSVYRRGLENHIGNDGVRTSFHRPALCVAAVSVVGKVSILMFCKSSPAI